MNKDNVRNCFLSTVQSSSAFQSLSLTVPLPQGPPGKVGDMGVPGEPGEKVE